MHGTPQKRVLFVAPSAYPLGGVAVWLDDLVPALESRGWSASVGLVAGKYHDARAYASRYPRINAFDIGYSSGTQEGRIRALAKALVRIRPDVVVTVNIVDVYAAVQRVRARGQSIRLVTALHAIAGDLLEDVRREAETIDAVIATNRLACRLCVEQSGVPVSRVFYAPCGVDVSRLGAMSRPAPGSALRIAWVGRLEQPQKRVHDIPAILCELDRLKTDYRLSVVGDGPARQEILQALDPWLKNGRVEYAGAIRPAEVAQLVYANADVLLVTSAWETGPIVAWEAMACRVAVVSSRYVGSGLEQALSDGRNCLTFAVGDAIAAARKLAQLAGDRAGMRDLAAAAMELVRARYTSGTSVAAWSESLDAAMQLDAKAPVANAPVACAGRLDHLLGTQAAETLREWLGLHFMHTGAGGEWPHTQAGSTDESAFLARAAARDVLA
jgi:glycosyltransferase involved in cell wall biosynthesis